MFIFLEWLVSALTVSLAAWLVPGVKVAGPWTALVLAAVLGLLNVVFKPLFIILTLPINILTLGLFTFVINALTIMLASSIVKGFTIGGFWNALLFSLVLSLVRYVFEEVLDKKRS